MKTAVIQPTEKLKRLVLLTRQFSDQIEVQSFDEIVRDRKIEVIITEQNELEPSDIIQIRQKFPNQKILILAESTNTFFHRSCIAHDVLLINKEMTDREQLDAIQKSWFGLEEQTEYHNVVALHGTHRQVGVTQLALSIGQVLGSFNYKTLVIGLNPFNPGDIHNSNATYSFEQIYDFVESNVIYDGNSLIPYLQKHKDFYYLTGNRDLYKAMSFEAKGVEQLIHFAKEYFDIVLLDIGSFYDSYLPLTGLQLSNTHILVSSQEAISMDEYKRWQDQVLNRFDFHPKSTYQVVNKVASRAIISPKQLEEAHSVKMLAQVPFFPEANDAIIEGGILYEADFRPYNKVIEGLAKAIADETTKGIEETKNSSFFKRFSIGGRS